MRAWVISLRLAMSCAALVLFLLPSCKRKSHPSAEFATDAGPRAVTVKLGAPVTDIEGDVWPRRAHQTSSMHELKGPLDLTVVLPSGRRFTVGAPRALGSTDDHHWPSLDDPPEKTVPNLERLTITVGKFPSWNEALDASNQRLATIGVAPTYIEKWDLRLRAKPTPHPSYPLEGCVFVGANLEKINAVYLVSIDVGIATPGIWHVHDDWPDTCPLDAGAR